MLKFIIIWGFPILFLFSSCRHPVENTAVIHGTLHDANGFKLVLEEMDTREIHPLDSMVADHEGKFNFTPVIKESGFWLLKAPTGKILVLLVNAGDDIELSGSVLDFPGKIIMKGPAEARALNEFYHHTRLYEQMVDSLEMLLTSSQDSSGFYPLTQKLDTAFRQIWENQRRYEISYIDHHPGSLSTLVVLNYAFGTNPVLSIDGDFACYQRVDSTLFSAFPKNKHVKFHHQRVEKKRNEAMKK